MISHSNPFFRQISNLPRTWNQRPSQWRAACGAFVRFMVCVFAAAAFGGAALAQSWTIKDGRNTGLLLPSESRKLPDGSTYLTGGSKVHVSTEDATYPIHGCSMECRWTCKIAASGSEGACLTHCVGVDKDGDLFSFRSSAFGAGKFEVGLGTGKYANASGGGIFEPVATDDPALTSLRWRGALQLRK